MPARAIAKLGARALHEQDKAYKYSSTKAREAANKRWAKYREKQNVGGMDEAPKVDR